MVAHVNKLIMRRENLTLFTLTFFSPRFTYHAHTADSDFQYGPTSFQDENRTFVSVDISQQNVLWSVSQRLSSVQAQSETIFSNQETGSPFFLLNPNTTGALVPKKGKESLEIKKIAASPCSKSDFYCLVRVLELGIYVEQFQYSFTPDLKMSSFLPIHYNEHAFVEATISDNYSYAHFKLVLEITIESQTSTKYQLITNGLVTKDDKPATFYAEYPSHLTSLSCFIDIVEIGKVIQSKLKKIYWK